MLRCHVGSNPSTWTAARFEADFTVNEDMDMCDPLPTQVPSRNSLAVPCVASARIPTPRYGSFLLPPSAQHGGSDVSLDMATDLAMRAMSLDAPHQVVENRILPSPISEGGTWRKDMGDVQMEVEMSQGDDTSSASRVPSSADQGRGRGRPVLVMGYRGDCERCRARVPGHYSHVIRT